MTTSKHHSASKKTAARKVSPKKATKKKALPAKTATKSPRTSALQHNKIAKQALEFMDAASSLLSNGIRESAKTTDRSRILAKKKAHDLLGKASRHLARAIEDGTTSLQGIIKKI
jgi:hypothetical protein